ncbi:MAG: YraN family protein [Firmicutes bacterium]|nr:YraN family protein [Bacillota bacterium]
MKLFGRKGNNEYADGEDKKPAGRKGLLAAANSPRAKGYEGEDMATAELLKRGYQILDRNYTTLHGEIDIVAEKDGVIHFVEVKSRDVHNYFFPATSITDNKRYQIAGVARQWFAEHGGERESCLLVAEVYMDNGEIILFQDFLL